jgi:hypothetical protein
MRFLIGLLAIFGGIAVLLWNTAPRVVSDFRHANEFVPASNLKVMSYSCTNWNLAMFDNCKVAFQSTPGTPPRQLEDWRFGWAPSEPIHLLQRRDDPSMVTTDVSLRTLSNRIAFVVSLILVGVLFILGLAAKWMRS